MECQFCGRELDTDNVQEELACFTDNPSDIDPYNLNKLIRVAMCNECGTCTRVDSESEDGNVLV